MEEDSEYGNRILIRGNCMSFSVERPNTEIGDYVNHRLNNAQLQATEPNRQTETLFVIRKTLPFLERPAEPRALEML